MIYCANFDRLPYCCGVYELGNLEVVEDEDEWECDDNANYDARCDSWEEVLREVNFRLSDGIVVQVWFVREQYDYTGRLNPEFTNNELRLLVQQIEGVELMHTGINPNSRNEIEGYRWINRK